MGLVGLYFFCLYIVLDCVLQVAVHPLADTQLPNLTHTADYSYRKSQKKKKKEMGRSPCCQTIGVKKGPWTPEEDIILVSYIHQHGPGNWRSIPNNTGNLIHQYSNIFQVGRNEERPKKVYFSIVMKISSSAPDFRLRIMFRFVEM